MNKKSVTLNWHKMAHCTVYENDEAVEEDLCIHHIQQDNAASRIRVSKHASSTASSLSF